MKFLRLILLVGLLVGVQGAFAQTTKIRGKVTDAESGEPIPLVSITFPGTTIGTTTDFDGMYTLETRAAVSELTAMFLSYQAQTLPVTRGAFNTIDFVLVPLTNDIETVVVRPGVNPAHRILKNISANKKHNDPDRKESYSYTSYTKMELDVANIKPGFRNKRMQRNFGFVFEHMDTSVVTGKAYLPVMISETSADFYYRRSPKLRREVVKASRMSGIEEDYSLAQFTGQLHVNVNLYENYINIFEVNFASPLSDHGLMYYDYFLVDSTRVEGRKLYKIRFHPKSKANPVFDGEVSIDSLTWALESASMRMTKGLNINWIRDMVIETRSQLVGPDTWFRKQDKIMADFTVTMQDSSKIISFMGNRQIDYSDIVLGEPTPPEIARLNNDVILDGSVLKNDDGYWQQVRPHELSPRERSIYTMVDSVKNAPLFRNIQDVIHTAIFGYYKVGKVEMGPYFKMYSFNKLEGSRFQMGARTTKDFSRKVRLYGYGAYSAGDSEFKGGGTVELMFDDTPFSKMTVGARRDVLQLGARNSVFATGNILSSVFSRGNNEKLTLINEYNIKWEKEWVKGVTNTFTYDYQEMFPTEYVDFVTPAGDHLRHIKQSQLRVGARLSKNEVVVKRPFENLSMGSKYPVLGVDFTTGLRDKSGHGYEFYRVDLNLRYSFNIAPLGRSELLLSGGKIFGKVPYPLLKLHEGNSTYFYDQRAYSCMNFYEFASDLWGSVFWEHHFRGFFLGRIPLMKKLKWREVASAKALWGRLSDKNNGGLPLTDAHLLFPEGMSSVSKPYIEAGVGVENIFRLFRVDAIWRVTHRDIPQGQKIDKFAVNFSMHVNF